MTTIIDFHFTLTTHSFKHVAFHSFNDAFNTFNILNTFVFQAHEFIKKCLKGSSNEKTYIWRFHGVKLILGIKLLFDLFGVESLRVDL